MRCPRKPSVRATASTRSDVFFLSGAIAGKTVPAACTVPHRPHGPRYPLAEAQSSRSWCAQLVEACASLLRGPWCARVTSQSDPWPHAQQPSACWSLVPAVQNQGLLPAHGPVSNRSGQQSRGCTSHSHGEVLAQAHAAKGGPKDPRDPETAKNPTDPPHLATRRGCAQPAGARAKLALAKSRPGLPTRRPPLGPWQAPRCRRRPLGRRQPPKSQRRPPKSQRQPPKSQRQPPKSQRQPPKSQRQPPKSQWQPPDGEQQPPKGERQPPKGERQPPKGERQPPKGWRRPPLHGRQPLKVWQQPMARE